MLCFITCLSVAENICFIAKLNWYDCLINGEDPNQFFPSLLLLFHNPIQNQIPEGETACPRQLSKPFMRQCFFHSRLCCINKEARMWIMILQWLRKSDLLSRPNTCGPGDPVLSGFCLRRGPWTLYVCSMNNHPSLPGTEGLLRTQGIQSGKGPGKWEVSQPNCLWPGVHVKPHGWRLYKLFIVDGQMLFNNWRDWHQTPKLTVGTAQLSVGSGQLVSPGFLCYHRYLANYWWERKQRGLDIEFNKMGSSISPLAQPGNCSPHPRGLQHCSTKGISTLPFPLRVPDCWGAQGEVLDNKGLSV